MDNDSMYGVITKALITLCLIVMSISLLLIGNEYNKMIDINERYLQYIEQYDTTTSYNKLVIYKKMMAMEDSIKSIK